MCAASESTELTTTARYRSGVMEPFEMPELSLGGAAAAAAPYEQTVRAAGTRVSEGEAIHGRGCPKHARQKAAAASTCCLCVPLALTKLAR